MRRRNRGYIAILSTLIIGAISLSIVLSLLLLGAASQQNSLATQQSLQARNVTNGCAEEGLLQLQANSSFTGTNTISIGTDTCSYTVANTGGSNRTVTANSTIGNVVRKVIVYVTITTSISVTSWQEIS